MAADFAIADLLREEGFRTAAALEAGRAALQSAGLTRPGKLRMSADKADRARAALDRQLVRHCSRPDCTAAVTDDGRIAVEVERAHCAICSGSNNRRALRQMVAACSASGVRRLLVVGGRPPAYAELERVVGRDLELRFIDGTSNLPNGTDALHDCAWADLLVIWAPTPLPHKVSSLYRAEVCGVAHRVTVHRRGLEALAAEVIEHLS
jgi:hypothetical protein